MSYIDRLNAIKAQKQPERSLTLPTQPTAQGQVSVVSVPSGRAFANPREALAGWRAQLDRLSLATPLHRLAADRWRRLVEDADWLLEHFGNAAARDGWSALDLFGVMPGRDAWGGIADRLRASRSLVMSPDIARWRRVINGEPESFARGGGEFPRLVAMWERGNA